MKLALIIYSLDAGGAERVMSILANYWTDKGWDITVITLASAENDFYILSPNVRRIALSLTTESHNLFQAVINNLDRIQMLRRTIKMLQPDAVISFMETTNVLTLLASRRLYLPVIVAEHTTPSQHNIKGAWSLLRRFSYYWADAVVVLTNDVAEWVKANLWVGYVIVIPNPVAIQETGSEAAIASFKQLVGENCPIMAAAGRLIRSKGFDLLIQAFAQVATLLPAWKLVIFGEGPERQALTKQIDEAGLTDRIILAGRVSQLPQLLKQAQLFVLASRYEGFSNVILEAMTSGVAVVSFDCPSGPREIIHDGIDGILVPPGNVPALAAAIHHLMVNETARQRLAVNAAANIQRYAIDNISRQWEQLLQTLSSIRLTR